MGSLSMLCIALGMFNRRNTVICIETLADQKKCLNSTKMGDLSMEMVENSIGEGGKCW